MAAWDSFRRLFHPRRILWQNWSGFYCLGLDQLCPVAVVRCIDDGREYDLIEQRSGLRFCCLERGGGRRAKFSGPALEEVLPGVRRQIEGILKGNGGGRWVIVCTLPCSQRAVRELYGKLALAPVRQHPSPARRLWRSICLNAVRTPSNQVRVTDASMSQSPQSPRSLSMNSQRFRKP